jgi:uncharacterized protein
LLGNISKTHISELVSGEKQRSFGDRKYKSLPNYCSKCEFLFTCYGECPKNRVLTSPDGEQGLNWLCSGLKDFFEHTKKHMELMADLLRSGSEASKIMKIIE